MMFRRRDLVPREMMQEAVAVAALSAAFNAHQVKCTEDKAEIKRQLSEQDAEMQRNHVENTTKLDKLNRVVWMAGGIGTTILFLSSALGQLILKALAGL